MDSITQAVLGATLQAALLGRWQGRKALLYGAALATLPDLDVVIDYGDAVAGMTYHRSFSHSLLVLTGLALALTLLLRWRPHPGYSAGRLFVTLWLVLATHPLLDAFTSYGTQLFWPFTPTPTARSTVFIIDPLYTAPLLVAVIGGLLHGLRDKSPRLPLLARAVQSVPGIHRRRQADGRASGGEGTGAPGHPRRRAVQRADALQQPALAGHRA